MEIAKDQFTLCYIQRMNKTFIFYPGNPSDVSMKWTEGFEDTGFAASTPQDTRDPLLKPKRMSNTSMSIPKIKSLLLSSPLIPTQRLFSKRKKNAGVL